MTSNMYYDHHTPSSIIWLDRRYPGKALKVPLQIEPRSFSYSLREKRFVRRDNTVLPLENVQNLNDQHLQVVMHEIENPRGEMKMAYQVVYRHMCSIKLQNTPAEV